MLVFAKKLIHSCLFKIAVTIITIIIIIIIIIIITTTTMIILIIIHATSHPF